MNARILQVDDLELRFGGVRALDEPSMGLASMVSADLFKEIRRINAELGTSTVATFDLSGQIKYAPVEWPAYWILE
jgi:ABC-type branched-subunit amino acid transport system ATPase component